MPALEGVLSLPRRWPRFNDPACGLLVLVRSPVVPPGGYLPTLALTVEPIDHTELGQWRQAAQAELAGSLTSFEAEDEDTYDQLGHPTHYLRFAHRWRTHDLIGETWAWQPGEAGVVLSATVARADYAEYCELFEDVAATVDPLAATWLLSEAG